jgi:hypothetical protein
MASSRSVFVRMRNDSMIFRDTNVLNLDPRADVAELTQFDLIPSHVYTRRDSLPYLAQSALTLIARQDFLICRQSSVPYVPFSEVDHPFYRDKGCLHEFGN